MLRLLVIALLIFNIGGCTQSENSNGVERIGDVEALFESRSNVGINNLSLVNEPHGTAMISFLNGNSDGVIRSRYFTPTNGWESVTNVFEGSHYEKPKTIFNSSGIAFAVALRWDPGGSGIRHVWANRFIPGQGWGEQEKISSHTYGNAYNPDISACPNGDIVIVWHWYDLESQNGNVWSSRHTESTGWDAPVKISLDNQVLIWEPKVACDSLGNCSAVWTQNDTNDVGSIWSNRFSASTGWYSSENISASSNDNYHPNLVVGKKDDALCVWSERNEYSSYGLWVNKYIINSGWEKAQQIGTNFNQTPSVAVLNPIDDDNVLVTWNLDDAIWSVEYNAKSGWEQPFVIVQDGNFAHFSFNDSRGILTWVNNETIYGRKITLETLTNDDVYLLDEKSENNFSRDPVATTLPDGSSIVCWIKTNGLSHYDSNYTHYVYASHVE